MVAVAVLVAVAAGCVRSSSALAVARWTRRSPAAAIVLWQAIALGWTVAVVGILFVIWPPAALILLGLLLWLMIAAALAVASARRRQRILLRLLARGDPKAPGALVVDHPGAAAYCVPGLRSAIVVSAGILDLLRPSELAAVLAHERAHLRKRHDLVLLPFIALLRVFGWSRTARRASRAVGLLVEMHADDRVLRQRTARELATALLRVGAAGGGAAPTGALAVLGSAASATAGSRAAGRGRAAGGNRAAGRGPGARTDPVENEVAARVTRLLRPVPGLPIPALALVGVVALLAIVLPTLAVVISF